MIRAKLNGKLLDGKFIGFKLPGGPNLYARPCFSFPVIAVPTQEWLDEYGSKYLAIVTLEEGTEEWLFMGLVPLDSNAPVLEGYENNYFVISKYFRIHLNDSDKVCVIQCLDNDGKILLGNKDVTEPGVLGNKNSDALKKLADFIIEGFDNFENAAFLAQDGGATLQTNTKAANLVTRAKIQQFSAANGDADSTKSETVKLK